MASAIITELRRGGSHTLKAVQRLVQSERVETVLAPELLHLATSNDTNVAVPSFLAFAKLCANSDVPTQLPSIFSAPDVALAVSGQLQSPDIRIQAAATLALTNLTSHNLALESTILSRVVEALEAENAHEGIQRALLGYIGNASAVPDASRSLLEETNCMQVLTELLQAGRGESLRSAAALTIGNVLSTRDVMAQNQLREVGGLPDLVLLLSSSYAPDTNESSAWALSHGVHLNVLSQVNPT
ncbi:hypothetical protein, variant [Aphanomyces invadans]|uniref:Armadillo repeat-containing domain-containing protein n=1 Tax=Aphanomyces invadans TaxID=157072 RepID=A0A024UGY3_9STRA|nr:hypothetical protein, variant [Aphanomyces invadans]ETW05425.1 hypothetical protein, variant [Aphanomyces invadans]|eukprot:XP_008865202.1 hypothetical protein, variant [Aphanomyces invadans]